MVLEKTLESSLDCKKIQLVHPKGDQSWVFTGRTDVEAETPILWPPHAKSWLIGKDPDAGKDWGQVEKGTTEDEMARWHHQLDGHEFGWTPGAGDGQGGLACCDSWDRKELDTTERLNWTELNWKSILKSRDITLSTKVHLVKAMVFPVVIYGCESWTIKKGECLRIDAFELWCWSRHLRVPWSTRRSNQSILRRSVLGVHWKDWCWSWNSNTLATWYKELTHLKRLWCWERLKAGGEGDDRGWDGWMASPT